MTQPSIENLVNYWQARRNGDAAPARSSIDPMDFPQLLPQVFMLGRRGPGDYVFRLVGGFVAEIHGLDLRGVDFTALWAQNARLPIKTALEGARHRVAPIHITCDVQAGQLTLPMAMVMLPLTNSDGVVDRYLGLYQPTAAVARMRGQAADRLALVTLNHQSAEEAGEPRIRLVAVAGQRVR